MEGEELRAGKERVRTYLIEPLNLVGLSRKSGVKVDQHEAIMETLEARLSYMSADNLAALAEVVERYADGPSKDRWPALTKISDWARDLQRPPPSESKLVRSYLQSAAGSKALQENYVVELRAFLKKWGYPPNAYNYGQIEKEAAENNRTLDAMAITPDHRLTAEQRKWRDGYERAYKICVTIIDAKADEVAA